MRFVAVVLEREIGLPLPPAYRSFLEAAGRGRLDYSVRLPACEPEPLQASDDLYQLGRDDVGGADREAPAGTARHGR
jgi:hypothetical protein